MAVNREQVHDHGDFLIHFGYVKKEPAMILAAKKSV